MTKEEFIEKAKKIHGDKYDYSKVDYVNNSTKVTIICPKHGEFYQNPNSHLNGNGCPSCKGLKRIDKDSFIERANRIHNFKYDYSLSNIVNTRSKIDIICPIHGVFSQLVKKHLMGQGCPECGKIKAQERNGSYKNARKTTEDFKNEVFEKSNGKYELISEYVNNKTNVDIFCHQIGQNGKEHGIFSIRPDDFVNGHGCPKCFHTISNGEDELFEFISSIFKGEIIRHDRKILDGKEIDIYIPSLKLGFEYNGLLWHSEKYRDNTDMLNKTDICEKNDIKLINIFEDEWINKKDICKSRIYSAIGDTERIFARKCVIKEISSKESSDFIERNHIQGNVSAKYRIGLYYRDELISVMTFGSLRRNLGSKSSDNVYEMLRFCNKINTTVVGGASKLLSYFIREYNPAEIVSYADRRWSNGHLYETLGFMHDKDTVPDYFYITNNGQKRINRFSMRKDILVKKYGCPVDSTEHEFCLKNGYLRVFDCGSKKYILKLR